MKATGGSTSTASGRIPGSGVALKCTVRSIGAAVVIAVLSGLGCMGTMETARVVPFRLGGTYFTLLSGDDDLNMPGLFMEGGWPAGPGRFGVGLHLKLLVSIETDDTGFLGIWGAKLQLPENPLMDIALAVDVWGYYPGEVKLHLSKPMGIFEPYVCVALANFLTDDDDDDGINFLGDGVLGFTAGTMVSLGRNSPWSLATEVETGSAWESPGIGAGLFRSF